MLCFQCGSPVQASDSTCGNCGATLVRTPRKIELSTSRGLRISQEIKAIRMDDRLLPPREELAGRYELAELIGTGPFGDVYRAYDTEVEANTAIKVYRTDLFENPEDLERFGKVAKIARDLNENHIVRIHDEGVHKGHPWVAMQDLEGLSLSRVLELRRSKGETFSSVEIAEIFGSVADAVGRGGQRNVHGDLKPENVIFLPGVVKVTDNYLVDAIEESRFVECLKDSVFLAPESRESGVRPDKRGDVYSLGMLFGRMSFGQDDWDAAELPDDDISNFLRKAVDSDPEARFPDVAALVVALKDVLSLGEGISEAEESSARSSELPPPLPPLAARPAKEEAAESIDIDSDEPFEDLGDEASGESREVSESQLLIAVDAQDAEEVRTTEFSREHHLGLQDVIATTEVGRVDDAVPSKESAHPTEPVLPVEPRRQTTSTAVRPGPNGWPRRLGIAALVVVVGALVWAVLLNKDDQKSVVAKELGQAVAATSGTASKELGGAVVDLGNAPEPQGSEAVDLEEVVVGGEKEPANPANPMDPSKPSENQGAADVPSEGKEAVDGVVGEAVPTVEAQERVAEETPKLSPSVGENSKPLPAKKEPEVVAKVAEAPEPKSTAPEEPEARRVVVAASAMQAEPKRKAKGRKCPSSMVLVRSKRHGNACVDAYEYPGAGAKPKRRVSWFEAKRLCASKGKRLCSHREWKSACGSKYPYGSKFRSDRCNTQDEDGFERSLAKSGSFKKCKSRSGAYDMSGNVFEWTDEQKIVGGSYESDESVASCRYVSSKAPASTGADIGFRCCTTPEK